MRFFALRINDLQLCQIKVFAKCAVLAKYHLVSETLNTHNPMTTTTTTEIEVYAPRAVIYGAEHAHEGGGGLVIPAAEAIALGATNIRPAREGFGYVADWPQHYFQA